MKTVEALENKIAANRFNFCEALKAAGYVDRVINNSIDNDKELLRLALEIYMDKWEAFNKKAFESLIF